METAVAGVLSHAAAHGLVALADITGAPVEAVIIADTPLAVWACESHHAAAGGPPWGGDKVLMDKLVPDNLI